MVALCVNSHALQTEAGSKNGPDTAGDTIESNTRPNQIARSHIELIGGATNAGNRLGINYVLKSNLLLGIIAHNQSKLSRQEGGDLDNGQYYKTTSGFSGKAILFSAKYFLKSEGITIKGWFVNAELGRSWGKYELSQDRYERDNGVIGNTFFGIDKKLAESSSDYRSIDTNIARASIGYAIPWVDGNLLKGISLQVKLGLENNSLPENQYLTNKFGSQNVGDDVKSIAFGELALGAYF